MTLLEMYNEFRTKFPDIAAKADIEHMKVFDDVNPGYAYSWFESLANAINLEMNNQVDPRIYLDVFEFIEQQYLSGGEEVKDCIDTAFTENLFWQVTSENAKSYWAIFPDTLKKLFVNFHSRSPV